VLRDAILLMQGQRSNARFHGQVYDAAEHLPRLSELLVAYFQVLQKPEHLPRLQSLDERAVSQKYQSLDTSRRSPVCLKYTLRRFKDWVAGAPKGQVERELRELNGHEALSGVWVWMLRLGFELGPDNRPQAAVIQESRAPARLEECKPVWDKLKRALTHEGRTMRTYRAPAEAQIRILDSFQELNWGDAIDSPFPDTKSGRNKLANAIKNLNRGLEHSGVIEFYGDGSGTHVCWRRL
jgi:hypothetical protein